MLNHHEDANKKQQKAGFDFFKMRFITLNTTTKIKITMYTYNNYNKIV